MAYEENITIPLNYTGGNQEFGVNNLQPILMSQIFSGTPQFYAGSSFQVEEVIEFGVIPVNPLVVDIDFRWYPPKYYLGNWSLFDQLSGFGTYPEDRGYIEDTISKVRRYSQYTIQGNANVPIAVHEQSAIDGCNFQLISAEIGIPPVAIEGSQLFEPIAAFKSRNTLQRVPLLDQPFNAKIKTIGFYIYEGCELTFLNYKARVINAISVDLAPFPITQCFYGTAPDCNQLFQSFLTDNAYYDNEAQALAIAVANCPVPPNISASAEQQSWTCPGNPLDVRQYWIPSCFQS